MNNLRGYEVSIWTLQDSFITVLKSYDAINQGQIEDPDFNIKNDGTLTFSFNIPMYLNHDNNLIENPIWYNVINGNIIASLRKIKIIFNKDEFLNVDEEARKQLMSDSIFEFIIVKVTEEHEDFELFCKVECEGLAFHELGKIGYKLALNQDTYFEDWDKWAEKNDSNEEEPRSTIDYWCKKILKNTDWNYKILMDWTGYDERQSDKIYEDGYIAAWDTSNDYFKPTTAITQKEKERLIDVKESNIYNISQTLAEAFGVYCKYQYIYDDNYHIIDKNIIFYNNFLREANDNETIDINYAYNTEQLSREMDGTDVVTKMFVKSLSDSNTESGLSTIADTEANKSQEDYILNFDYLYSIGTITEEQYKEIEPYEIKMHNFNQQLKKIENERNLLEEKLIDDSAAETVAKNAIGLDTERINAATELLSSITNNSGLVHITNKRPDTYVAIQELNGNKLHYINLRQKGILASTISIYTNFDYANSSLSNKLESIMYKFEYDEFNNLVKIKDIILEDTSLVTLYLTYSYQPRLYYENIENTWKKRLTNDMNSYNKLHDAVLNEKEKIKQLNERYDDLLLQKNKVISNFEKLMGPAIREGHWQPEDEYAKYGEKHKANFELNNDSYFNGNLISIGWDDKIFDDEELNYQEIGVTQERDYYMCIKLSPAVLKKLSEHVDNLSQISFIYTEYEGIPNEPSYKEYTQFLPIGSQCSIHFLRNDLQNIVPVLMLTGLNNTDNILNKRPRIGFIDIGGIEGETITSEIIIVTNSENTSFVYPRIQISSTFLKTSEDTLVFKNDTIKLNNYEDYYLLNRINDQSGEIQYYITLKPETLLKSMAWSDDNQNIVNYGTYTCLYELSNTSLFMYLDALQIARENAYPKVTYEVKPAYINPNFIKYSYKYLNHIVHINDPELKFEYVKGYITELKLALDSPEDDRISVDNYKTKFEDLFSTIVAQTEQMKKNSTLLGITSKAFTAAGELQPQLAQTVLNQTDLNYAFNNGTLTINNENGIWGTSDSGVVAFRGGGIFTATEKDSNDEWIWNTGILPSGINASLITTGQLDTNLIRIFAGNDLKLQMNGDGLFAYRSQWINNGDNTQAVAVRPDGLDLGQYVVHNSEGLFLHADAGTKYTSGNTIKTLRRDVDRVEISWLGLILRNWNGESTLWADPDTGNLNIKGKITATSLYIGENDEQSSSSTIDDYINDKVSGTIIDKVRDEVQKQVDSEIDAWYNGGKPLPEQDNNTTRLRIENSSDSPSFFETAWALEWDSNNNSYSTESIQKIQNHNSDIYYDTTSEYVYRFTVIVNSDSTTWYWAQINDTAITEALKKVSALEREKIQSFYAEEKIINNKIAPDINNIIYNDGDLWINKSRDNRVYRYTTNENINTWEPIIDSIVHVYTQYATNNDKMNPPIDENEWKATIDSVRGPDNRYIWTRNITYKNGEETINEPIYLGEGSAIAAVTEAYGCRLKIINTSQDEQGHPIVEVTYDPPTIDEIIWYDSIIDIPNQVNDNIVYWICDKIIWTKENEGQQIVTYENPRESEYVASLKRANNSIDNSIQNIQNDYNNLRDIVNNLNNNSTNFSNRQEEIEQYMSFTPDEGLILGGQNSQFYLKLNNSELGFYDDQDKVAYINDKRLTINEMAVNKMALGNYIWIPNGGHLSMMYNG